MNAAPNQLQPGREPARDLVTRLRRGATNGVLIPCEDLVEAADRIEELTKALGHIEEVAIYGAKKINEIDAAIVSPKVAGSNNAAAERFLLIARTAKASALPLEDRK